MKTLNDFVPILLVVGQAIQVLVLYAFKASIRIAILEMLQEVAKHYASKEELAKVEEKVELADRIDRGFAQLAGARSSRS